MRTRQSTIFLLLVMVTCFAELHGQSICIQLKNGSQFSYPTNCIRKISFDNKQLILDLINPTPVILHIDSIQTIKYISTPPLTTMNSKSNRKEQNNTPLQKRKSNDILVSNNEKSEEALNEILISSI